MKSVFRKAAALGLIFCMSCMMLAGCGNNGAIDGSKTLMTVNGEDLRLGAASFFAKYEQAQTYMIYNMYFGMTSIFDTAEEDGHTAGEEMKESVLTDLEKMMVIKQHAEEYGVSVTDEQAAQIQEAAKAYIEGNDKAALAKVGASEEDVVTLLELQTIRSSMMDPIVKDVDTEVTDEEAQQTSVTYVRVNVEETTDSAAESTAESSAESTAASAAESTAASKAESTTASVTESTAASTAESTAASAAASKVESTTASVAESTPASTAESTAASAAESTAESTAASAAESAAESTAESAAESTAEASENKEETEAMKEAKAYAEAIISGIQESEDIAAADMDAIAKEIDENYSSATGHFSTNDPSSSSLDANLVEAVKGLSDGEIVDHPVLNVAGDAYFVVRVDKVFDEDATNTEKENIVVSRKQTLYDETVDGWLEEAEIKVNEDVWKSVTITDTDPVTLKTPEAEEEETAGEDTASGASSTAEEAASEAASTAGEAASEAASAAAEAVSEAAAAAEGAVSEAAEAVSAAASTASETASETASAATSAAETVSSTASAS